MNWKPPDHWHPALMRQWSMYTHALPESRTWSMTDFPFPVTLDWARRPSMEQWNLICAWSVDHFGLPGIRYQTEVDTARMTWYFADERDQLIMTLAWGNDGV